MRKFLLILGIVSFFILTISLLTSSCKTKEGVDSTLTPPAPQTPTDTNASLGAPPSISTTVNAALSQLNTINGGSTVDKDKGSSVPIVAATANPTTKPPAVASTAPTTGAAMPATGAGAVPPAAVAAGAGAATPAAAAAAAAGAATPATGAAVPPAAGAGAGVPPAAGAGAAVPPAATPAAGVVKTTEGFQNLSSPTVLQPTLYY